jgi:hypothetical protein
MIIVQVLLPIRVLPFLHRMISISNDRTRRGQYFNFHELNFSFEKIFFQQSHIFFNEILKISFEKLQILMDLKLVILCLDKRLVLRSLNCQHLAPRYESFQIPDMCYSKVEMISTDSSDANNHRFHSHINSIEFFMPRYMARQVIQPSSNVPFRNVHSLVIYFEEELSTISFLKHVFQLSE